MKENKCDGKQTSESSNISRVLESTQQAINPKKRPRPSLQANEKDVVKKKRKLLSFGEQIQQEAEVNNVQRLRRVDQNEKNKKKFELSKQNAKENIEEDLKAEYLQKIQKLRDEMFEVDYSYWDGPMVVKKLKRKKKETVKNLIEHCRLELIANFQSLASLTANDLLMVIKDSIIPHSMTIADVEALQLRTAKGDLLLNFKNVKIKDLSLSVNMEGPTRIIEKSKYEKNISSYPFNTWKEMNID